MPKKKFIKPEIRIIGWDDTKHTRKTRTVLLVGAIFRGGSFMDGLLSVRVKKDGMDSTEKIAEAVRSSRHYDQLSIIMLDGITFAGFNVVDVKKLNKLTKLPVIAVQRKRPDMKEFKAAIRKIFPDWRKRLEAVAAAGPVRRYLLESKFAVFYQRTGIPKSECEKVLEVSCTHGIIPEPVRVAHLIAGGLSGESKGRA